MNNISVSTLVRYLKNKLDSDSKIQGVLVSGELSNFKLHSSGHLYFTLKDDKSAISCVMFSSKASHLKFKPKSGDKVIVSANVSIFETTGQLQLYVNSMKLDGIGDLYARYEELKNKLIAEGIFNDDHKKDFEIVYPNNVAVLVGDNSAAMSDIKTQFNRRWPLAKVDYYPVLVQGIDAPKDIIDNLLKVDKLNYDYIILARGGGSFEDLFCFNDENLIRTIYNLNTFIITGIGHEQDYTLADFASDMRAPTPTATVELTTPNINDVYKEIAKCQKNISHNVKFKIYNMNYELENLSKSKYLSNPKLLIDKVSLRIDYYETLLSKFDNKINSYLKDINILNSRMNILLKNKISLYKTRIDSYKYSLSNYNALFDGAEFDIFLCEKSLNKAIKRKLNDYKIKIDNYDSILKVLGIDNTLKRGYSLVYKDNKLLNSTNNLNINDELTIRMYDGKLKTVIKEKDNG